MLMGRECKSTNQDRERQHRFRDADLLPPRTLLQSAGNPRSHQ